jgi:hypothetical protein
MILYGVDMLSGYRARWTLQKDEDPPHESNSRPPELRRAHLQTSQTYIINAWLVILPDMSRIL